MGSETSYYSRRKGQYQECCKKGWNKWLIYAIAKALKEGKEVGISEPSKDFTLVYCNLDMEGEIKSNMVEGIIIINPSNINKEDLVGIHKLRVKVSSGDVSISNDFPVAFESKRTLSNENLINFKIPNEDFIKLKNTGEEIVIALLGIDENNQTIWTSETLHDTDTESCKVTF